jgi:hypothetical protein
MRSKHGPEFKIQTALIEFLRARGWLVERLIGNAYQQGLPDIFIHHPKWGSRWIDVKNPGRYSFTTAQKWKWPRWESFGLGVWILTAATQEEYDKLFAPPNWRSFVKESWKLPTRADIDKLLEEIE